MYKIEAKKEGDNIIIHKDSFEMILACLDNQKFLNTIPNGDAIADGKESFDATNRDIQKSIDNINRQCRGILHDLNPNQP